MEQKIMDKIKALKRKIGRLNLELSDVRKRESDIMKEMRKYCKELDKLVNKGE
jgi:regulator of replication initiation timing